MDLCHTVGSIGTADEVCIYTIGLAKAIGFGDEISQRRSKESDVNRGYSTIRYVPFWGPRQLMLIVVALYASRSLYGRDIGMGSDVSGDRLAFQIGEPRQRMNSIISTHGRFGTKAAAYLRACGLIKYGAAIVVGELHATHTRGLAMRHARNG
ncbi:hypothetical protein FHW69_001243 [Luteibacter sp. Sphag1AF]|nr:hypothetical protein [Luteibacter sp. Sphag1AF]